VVIDPGHGGENTGTHSVLPHLVEKQLTLDWALRLEPLLRQQGWQVILTRTTDVDVSLAERVSVAERVGADLFVSLHFNSAYPQSDLKGPETYCLTPVGMPSTLTRNYEDDVSREFPNNRHDDQNVLCAFRLHRALVEASGGLDRGLRRARFMGVLRGQNRPAVLLEAGYLSNPDEAARIGSPDYRQRLAEAVARALRPTPSLARDNPRGGHPGEAAP
jgi:N-acetylmuramoyl-L-alanine amidase